MYIAYVCMHACKYVYVCVYIYIYAYTFDIWDSWVLTVPQELHTWVWGSAAQGTPDDCRPIYTIKALKNQNRDLL